MLQDSQIEISVIVPVGPRHDDIAALHTGYRDALVSTHRTFEFVYVVDGSFRETMTALEQLIASGERITAVYLTRTFGEATALMAGFEHAVGQIILTLPAYSQIRAEDTSRLLDSLHTHDLVISRREPRASGVLEGWRRNSYHRLVSWMTGIKVQDLGCGARAMKRQVLEEIALYGDQHLHLPALADRRGFRVIEVPVRQSAQDRNVKGHRTRDYAHRLLDVFAIYFLLRFTKKPLRFFGMVGASVLSVGAVLMLYLIVERAFFAIPLANRPALLLSSLLVVLGLQLFALGLLAELIIFTHARDLKDYQIDRIIEFPAAATTPAG